jgi:hypothetical protein
MTRAGIPYNPGRRYKREYSLCDDPSDFAVHLHESITLKEIFHFCTDADLLKASDRASVAVLRSDRRERTNEDDQNVAPSAGAGSDT